MTATEIQAEVMPFYELFLSGKFRVPWHQRKYDWEPDNVRALLDDVAEAIAEDRPCYFVGSIMLIGDEHSDEWEINDGQQRMVSMSLVYASLCRAFHETLDAKRVNIAGRALFAFGADTHCNLADAEHYAPRIMPPQDNIMHYRQIVRGNNVGANGKLVAAWREVEEFFSPMGMSELKEYLEFVTQKLEVARLLVPQHMDPTVVFEAVNSRGKSLDDVDRIRNYIYSHFNPQGEKERRNTVHDNLERISTVLKTKASGYLRCHLQCRYGFLPADHFYKETRKATREAIKDDIALSNRRRSKISKADYVFRLVEDLSLPGCLDLFQKITAATPDPDFIAKFNVSAGTTRAKRDLAVFLRELRGYRISYPLVFALLFRCFQERDGRKRRYLARVAHRNLSRLSAFVLRTAFVAPKFESSQFEKGFSDYAKHILGASEVPDAEFADFLRECDRPEYAVLNDAKFKAFMETASMTARPKIMLLLFGINANMPRSGARLLNPNQCTVEHILSPKPVHWDGWPAFTAEGMEAKEWANRVGNMTLMGPDDNKSGAKFNASFARKREAYKDSAIALTREVAERHDDWTPEIVAKRQRELATRATEVWAFK